MKKFLKLLLGCLSLFVLFAGVKVEAQAGLLAQVDTHHTHTDENGSCYDRPLVDDWWLAYYSPNGDGTSTCGRCGDTIDDVNATYECTCKYDDPVLICTKNETETHYLYVDNDLNGDFSSYTFTIVSSGTTTLDDGCPYYYYWNGNCDWSSDNSFTVNQGSGGTLVVEVMDEKGDTYSLGSYSFSLHSHEYNQQNVSDYYKCTDATCDRAATYYYACSCGDRGSGTYDYGSALGHDEVMEGTEGVHSKCNRCGAVISVNHNYTSTVETPSSCTGQGTTRYSCSCGYSYTVQDISSLGHEEVNGGTEGVHSKCNRCGVTLSTSHNYTSTVETPSSCTEQGTTRYSCSCGYSYTVQDISSLGHVEVNGGTEGVHSKCSRCGVTLSGPGGHNYTETEEIPSSCTEKGTTRYTCSCGYSYTAQDISELGHVEEPGGTEDIHSKCSRCGVTLSGPGGHNYTETEEIPSSCTEKGTTRYTCSCGYSYTLQDIPELGHVEEQGGTEDIHSKCSRCGVTLSGPEGHSYTETEEIPSSCTEKGTTRYTCSCGYSYTAQDIPELGHEEEPGGTEDIHSKCNRCGVMLSGPGGHNYTETEEIPSSCTEKGTTRYTCSCGYSYTLQDIPELGHVEEPGGTEDIHSKCSRCGGTLSGPGGHNYTETEEIPSSCTEKGTTRYTCSCGYSYTLQDIPELGHVEEPGGTEDIHSKCSRCGVTLSGPEGHSYTETEEIPSSCTEKGTTRYTCSCGYSYTLQDIPELGHEEEPGGTEDIHSKCSRCGVTLSGPEGHSYTETEEIPSSCTEKGTTRYTCSCGYSYTLQDIPELGHDEPEEYAFTENEGIENGEKYKNCDRCGERLETLYMVSILGGKGLEYLPESFYAKAGDSIQLTVLERKGYRFDSWKGYVNSNSFIMPERAVKMTANAVIITYPIEYELAGGVEQENPSSYTVESEITLKEPFRVGYIFKGWSLGDKEGELQKEGIIKKGSTEAVKYTAHWEACSNTEYVVKHYIQNLDDDGYTLVKEETRQGKSDAEITLQNLSCELTGFTYKEAAEEILEGKKAANTVKATEGKINADGSSVFQLFYSRNKYTLTVQAGPGIQQVTGEGTYKFGQIVTVNADTIKNPKYQFENWKSSDLSIAGRTKKFSFGMPAKDLNITAYGIPTVPQKLEVSFSGTQDVGSKILTEQITARAAFSDGIAEKISGTELFFIDADGNRVKEILIKKEGTNFVQVEYVYNNVSVITQIEVEGVYKIPAESASPMPVVSPVPKQPEGLQSGVTEGEDDDSEEDDWEEDDREEEKIISVVEIPEEQELPADNFGKSDLEEKAGEEVAGESLNVNGSTRSIPVQVLETVAVATGTTTTSGGMVWILFFWIFRKGKIYDSNTGRKLGTAYIRKKKGVYIVKISSRLLRRSSAGIDMTLGKKFVKGNADKPLNIWVSGNCYMKNVKERIHIDRR